jgi:kinesin family protein 6/9
VLLPSCTQEECYASVAKDLVEGAVLGGVSGCVLAYGQTGSGKTHSMLGSGGGGSFEGRGVMPRALSHAFALAEGLASRGESAPTFRMSFVEVLDAGIVDLLAKLTDFSAPAAGGGAAALAASASAAILKPLSAAASGGGATALAVAEDKGGRTYIPGLLMPRVASEGEARHFLLEGSTNRAIAGHALNHTSSRSHAILTLYIEHQHPAEGSAASGAGEAPRTVTVASRLHLVDLAGSERVEKTLAEGARLREAAFINKSLSALEAVVIALGEVQASHAANSSTSGGFPTTSTTTTTAATSSTGHYPRDHVPYRSSRLTHFLKGALGGGKGSTCLLATLWPDEAHSDECIATLRFAGRMMNLRTLPVKDVVHARGGALDVEERARLMALHAAELDLLRRELALHDVLCGRGEGSSAYAPLSLGEAGVVRELVQRFLAGEVGVGEAGHSALVGGALNTVRHIEEALLQLRAAVWEARAAAGGGAGAAKSSGGGGEGGGSSSTPLEAASSSAAASAAAGAAPAEDEVKALDAWRQTSPEYAAFVEARKTVKELRARYSAAALRVNEAKKLVDAALQESAAVAQRGLGGVEATFAATRLVECKASYKAKYEEATAVRAEAEYAQSHADALAKLVAGAFQASKRV